jgi:perosamine synthetase
MVLITNSLSGDMNFLELQKKYSEYIGSEYAVSVNTGTAALHLALESLELPQGSEVIVPEFTMIASAWAVKYAGLEPVFVDCDDNLLLDIEKLKQAITPRTKVIMPVHIYGRVCNMTEIMKLAERHDIRVIEDAAEAQGAKWDGKMVGSFDIGCFSFYWNKIINAEEGGIITTNDKIVYDNATDMKSMGFGAEHNYLHRRIGFNYRMSNAQAGLALESLSKVDKNLKRRKEIESLYDSLLPENVRMPKREVVWVYDINVGEDKKDNLVSFLKSQGIAARHSFKPMSMQPTFSRQYENLNAFKLSKEVCYLPVTENMTDEQVKTICDKVKDFLNEG